MGHMHQNAGVDACGTGRFAPYLSLLGRQIGK